jgi:hypothetical protein
MSTGLEQGGLMAKKDSHRCAMKWRPSRSVTFPAQAVVLKCSFGDDAGIVLEVILVKKQWLDRQAGFKNTEISVVLSGY